MGKLWCLLFGHKYFYMFTNGGNRGVLACARCAKSAVVFQVIKLDIDRSAKPRVHGNGFIQLDLNPEGTRRLHVWHEAIPRQVVATPIHDHVFDMRSNVLVGTLVHEELVAVEDEQGTHRIYRAQQEPGTQNTTLVPDEGTVVLEVVQKLVLGAESIYTFPAWNLHQTDHHGLTATVMEKVNAPSDYGRPRVLVPVGNEPDNDFKRDNFNSDILWPFIDMAIFEARKKGTIG